METLSKKQSGATLGVYIVICAVYFVIPDMGYISPSLAAIAEHFGVDPGVASYLATAVSIAQIGGALVCGLIVGKFVKHKTMLMIAAGGMGIIGMLPALLPENTPYMVLLIDRIVFGFFLGFLQPIIFAYIAQVFVDENKRAAGYGIGNVAFNVGAVFATSVGGICVGIGWNTAFWLYAVGIIVLIIVAIFYKEPDGAADAEKVEEKGEKAKITGIAWFLIAIWGVAMICDYPFFTALIPALLGHNICDAVIGGQLMSLFTAVGIVASAIFGFMFSKFKNKLLPIAVIMAGVGDLLLFLGLVNFESLAFVILAICILGFGHSTLTVGTPHMVSLVCAPAVASAALAYTAISMNLGVFISSPYMQAVTSILGTTDYSVVYAASGVIMIVYGIIVWVVINKALGNVKNTEVSE